MAGRKTISEQEARERLRDKGLRVTAPRLAVIQVLSSADDPISFTQVRDELQNAPFDQATIYRNLIKLREAGMAKMVGRMNGIDRYVLTGNGDEHTQHPHFLCKECGRLECLETEVSADAVPEGPWAESIRAAMMQLTGRCPDCIAQPSV